MLINRISGCTRVLGKPPGVETKVKVIGLPIRDCEIDGVPCMASSWQPTPDEIARIAMGAPIYLVVVGSEHPPVSLTVGQLVAEPQEP